MKLGCILMASGAGRRFGSNKLLAQVDGISLAARALAVLSPSFFSRILVVSRYPALLDMAETAGVEAVYNPCAEEGISSSIRLGLGSLTELDGVLFSVCDQPWLRSESVSRLLDAFQTHPEAIVALSRAGKRGNPVLFPQSLFSELLALQGDTGGGAVIRTHLARLLLVEATDPHELDDVDTPEDL